MSGNDDTSTPLRITNHELRKLITTHPLEPGRDETLAALDPNAKKRLRRLEEEVMDELDRTLA